MNVCPNCGSPLVPTQVKPACFNCGYSGPGVAEKPIEEQLRDMNNARVDVINLAMEPPRVKSRIKPKKKRKVKHGRK